MSAYEKLEEAFRKAVESLEKERSQLRRTLEAYDNAGEVGSEFYLQRREIEDSKGPVVFERTELEGKVEATRELLARHEDEVLSWNQLNTAYKNIWGKEIPGYPKIKSSDSEERKKEIRALRKEKRWSSLQDITLKDRIKEADAEIQDLGSEIEAIETEISEYDENLAAERKELEDKETEYDRQIEGTGSARWQDANEDQMLEWMWDNGFRSELEEVVEPETVTETDAEGRRVETVVSGEGRLELRNKIDQLAGRDAEARREVAEIEQEQLQRFRDRPDTGVEDAGDPSGLRLTPSEREREFGGTVEEEIPDLAVAEIEEELATERERQALARITDPLQAVPEFGAPVPTPPAGPPLPETYQDELDAIADALGITGGFGANFFLGRDDMMILHPVTKEKVNILEYIMDEELTGGKEVEELLEQTQWWVDTNTQMRAFDLEWNRLGDGSGIPNTSQLGYIQPTIDTVKTQLTKLGVELDQKVIDAIAKSAARLQLTGRQLREHLSDLDGFEGFDFDALVASQKEGLLGTYRDDIEKQASKWMVSLGDDIDEETMNEMIESFYEGGGTQDDLDIASTYFANQAKALYPTLAPIIDQGISLSTYFLPYKQRVQQLLERPIDFLGADHSLFDKITSFAGAGEGIPRVATFSEVDRMIKSDRSSGWWETTQAANQSRGVADMVGRMFGMVAP